jgi:hypothetical protein
MNDTVIQSAAKTRDNNPIARTDSTNNMLWKSKIRHRNKNKTVNAISREPDLRLHFDMSPKVSITLCTK